MRMNGSSAVTVTSIISSNVLCSWEHTQHAFFYRAVFLSPLATISYSYSLSVYHNGWFTAVLKMYLVTAASLIMYYIFLFHQSAVAFSELSKAMQDKKKTDDKNASSLVAIKYGSDNLNILAANRLWVETNMAISLPAWIHTPHPNIIIWSNSYSNLLIPLCTIFGSTKQLSALVIFTNKWYHSLLAYIFTQHSLAWRVQLLGVGCGYSADPTTGMPLGRGCRYCSYQPFLPMVVFGIWLVAPSMRFLKWNKKGVLNRVVG